MQAVQLLLRLTKAAKGFALQHAVVEECSEHACSRMQSFLRRAMCTANKPGVTRLEPHYAKAPRLDSVKG